MHYLRMLCYVFTVSLVWALLAGCGGGGSTSDSGRISGVVSQQTRAAGLTRATDEMTVSLDGTNLLVHPDSAGHFVLERVPPGLHTLFAVTADNARAFALVVRVARGRETSVGDVVLEDAGWITGMVTADGKPVAGARVTVTEVVETNATDELPHPVRLTLTATDGTYSVHGLPAGSYLVTICAAGYLPVSLPLLVQAGSTTIGDARLTALPATETGSMAGVVSLALDNGESRPLPGVLVRLLPVWAPDPENPLPTSISAMTDGARLGLLAEYYTFTGEDGAYTLDGVPAGSYLAVAVRPGLDAAKQQVPITAGSTLSVNFTLKLHEQTAGIVTGKVSDATSGAPIAGAVVRAVFMPQPMTTVTNREMGGVIEPDGSEFRLYAITDAHGVYQLLVPETVTAVAAEARGYLPDDVSVTVQPGATVTADLVLTPLSESKGTITGIVLSARDNTPIAGAAVSALFGGVIEPNSSVAGFAADVLGMEAVTDADGAFTLTVPTTITQLGVRAKGYEPQLVPVTVTANETVTLSIKLAPAEIHVGEITGMVTADATGTPIPGALVNAVLPVWITPLQSGARQDAWEPLIFSTRTDSTGKYLLRVPDQVTMLAVGAEGFQRQTVTVTVVPGHSVTMNVTLHKLELKTIMLSGKVGMREGDHLVPAPAGTHVYALPDAGGGGVIMGDTIMPSMVYTADVNADGSYVLSLPAGSYAVYAAGDNLRSETFTATFTANTIRNFLLVPLPSNPMPL